MRRSKVGSGAGVALVASLMGTVGTSSVEGQDRGGASRPDAPPACVPEVRERPLPAEVRESSGLARSLQDPGVFWTHNDRGNDPRLFAVGEDGRLLREVVVDAEAVDWEDVETTRCREGTCLYVADVGDNDGDRLSVTIHRIVEPDDEGVQAVRTEELRARFPEGPRDAEAMFALPSGDLFLVTKGRRHDVELYRLPAPQRPGETVLLERVLVLFPEPGDGDDRVTAATATPNGRWIGIRTYRTLYIYEAEAILGGRIDNPIRVDLEPMSEPQGEGVAMADDGTVWLSSEARNRRSNPLLSQMACTLPPQ